MRKKETIADVEAKLAKLVEEHDKCVEDSSKASKELNNLEISLMKSYEDQGRVCWTVIDYSDWKCAKPIYVKLIKDELLDAEDFEKLQEARKAARDAQDLSAIYMDKIDYLEARLNKMRDEASGITSEIRRAFDNVDYYRSMVDCYTSIVDHDIAKLNKWIDKLENAEALIKGYNEKTKK